MKVTNYANEADKQQKAYLYFFKQLETAGVLGLVELVNDVSQLEFQLEEQLERTERQKKKGVDIMTCITTINTNNRLTRLWTEMDREQ